MHQDKDLPRLINSFAGSIILHVFFLSFSQQIFWKLVENSPRPGQPPFHEPLTVRLVSKLSPSAVMSQPVNTAVSIPPLTTQQAAKPSSMPLPASTKPLTSTYHDAHELTQMPEMIGQPPAAIEMGQGTSGEVVFKLSINRFGKVTLLQSLKSTLPRDIEGKLAMQLYRAEYRPGEIDGIAVDSEMTVDLKLDSGGWLTDKLPVLRQEKSEIKP